MERQLRQLGFTLAAEHDAGRLRLYRQGRIAFVVNTLPAGQAAEFRKLHGPSANGMAFRVADAAKAHGLALERGATDADTSTSALPGAKALEGIGGSLLYLVEGDPFADWDQVPGWQEATQHNSVGLDLLDHLTHNVKRGQMRVWSAFMRNSSASRSRSISTSRARPPACSARR